MKKLLSLVLSILIINSTTGLVLGQVNINQNLDFDANIPSRNLYSPNIIPRKPLPPTEPTYAQNPNFPSTRPQPGPGPGPGPAPSPGGTGSSSSSTAVASSSGGGSGMAGIGVAMGASLPVVVGGGLLALFLRRKKAVNLPPIVGQINPRIDNDPQKSSFDFQFGEEIMYYLVFKNSPDTPIYKDTVMYIKIPSWLEYRPESTIMNNVKLTDKGDYDILTFYESDSLLVINVGAAQQKELVLNFGAKVLTQSISKNEAFCEVKFQSVSEKYESGWHKMSVFPEKTLPPVLEKTLSTK